MPHDLDLALQHHRAGRHAEAEANYRRILTQHPEDPAALYGLGALALQSDQYATAIDLLRRAIAVRADWPHAHYHLALALQGSGNFAQAIASHRRAIALNPQLFEANFNLAVCLQITGQGKSAIPAFERAIVIKPDDPLALINFAIALRGAGRIDDAIASARKAAELKPDFAEAWIQLGQLLLEKDHPQDACAALARALQLSPNNPHACAAQAQALWAIGKIDEALELQQRVVTAQPNDPQAHTRLASLLLMTGECRDGFAELEWRSKIKRLPWTRRELPSPRWDGGELAGKTILIHWDGCYADTIQFVRFLPALADRGAKIVAESQPALTKLLEASFPDVKWFSHGEDLPSTDYHLPLSSLPLALEMEQRTNWQGPYLRAPNNEPPLSVSRDAKRSAFPGRPIIVHPDLDPPEKRKSPSSLNIALVWAGSPSEIQDSNRSITLQKFSPLSQIPGLAFFSLQTGWSAKQTEHPPFPITDLRNQLNDFAHTAAFAAQMDLIITVDTAMAHLAGAMGKPVWTLLQFVPHWRWGMHGDRTPWYPTMKLFRQKKRGDWNSVAEHVASELKMLC